MGAFGAVELNIPGARQAEDARVLRMTMQRLREEGEAAPKAKQPAGGEAVAGEPPPILLSAYRWHEKPSTGPPQPSVREAAPLAASSDGRAPSPDGVVVGPEPMGHFSRPTESSTIRAAELAWDRGQGRLGDRILEKALREEELRKEDRGGSDEVGSAGRSGDSPRPTTAGEDGAHERPIASAVASAPALPPSSLQQPSFDPHDLLAGQTEELPRERYLAAGSGSLPRLARATGASALFPFRNAPAAAVDATADGRPPSRRQGVKKRSVRTWMSAR